MAASAAIAAGREASRLLEVLVLERVWFVGGGCGKRSTAFGVVLHSVLERLTRHDFLPDEIVKNVNLGLCSQKYAQLHLSFFPS